MRNGKEKASKARILLFPYSGVGASLFQEYHTSSLPIDILPVQLPGREDRLQEKPYTDMSLLVDQLIKELKPYFDVPMIFYGHCLGAFIAYELALKLKQAYQLELLHLFVSACAAPHIHSVESPIHKLSSKLFLEEVQSTSYFNDAQPAGAMCKILLSGLRADFALYEAYYRKVPALLECDITAFYGKSDSAVNLHNIARWAEVSTKKFDIYGFTGDHLFIHHHLPDMMRFIEDKIEKKL